MICPKCKSNLPDGSVFCQYCGAQLSIDGSNQFIGQADSKENLTILSTHEDEMPLFTARVPVLDGEYKRVGYCRKCGGKIDTQTGKCTLCGRQYFRWKTAVPFILLCMIICGLGAIIFYCYGIITELQDTIADNELTIEYQDNTLVNRYDEIIALKKEIDEYKSNSQNQTIERRFYENYAGIVFNDGTSVYHTYGCEECDFTKEFWIYNIDAAEDSGYKPCSKCH